VIYDEHGGSRLDGDGSSLYELLARAVFEERTSDSALTLLNWLVQWGFELPIQISEPIPPLEHDYSQCGFAGWFPSGQREGRRTSPLPLSSLLPATHNDPVPDVIGRWWSPLLVGAPSPPRVVPSLEGAGVGLLYWTAGENNWRHTGPRSTSSGCLQLTDDALTASARIHNKENVDPALLRRIELTGAAKDTGFLRRLAEDPWDLMGLVGLRVPLSSVSRVRCWHRVVTKAALLDRKSKALIAERGYGIVNVAGVCIEFSDGWRPLALQLGLEFPGEAGAAAVTEFASAVAHAAATLRLREAATGGEDRKGLEMVVRGPSPLTRIRTPVPGTTLGQQDNLVLGAALPGSSPISAEPSSWQPPSAQSNRGPATGTARLGPAPSRRPPSAQSNRGPATGTARLGPAPSMQPPSAQSQRATDNVLVQIRTQANADPDTGNVRAAIDRFASEKRPQRMLSDWFFCGGPFQFFCRHDGKLFASNQLMVRTLGTTAVAPVATYISDSDGTIITATIDDMNIERPHPQLNVARVLKSLRATRADPPTPVVPPLPEPPTTTGAAPADDASA
jgi:hypothetical protein